MTGHAARMGEMTNAYRSLVGKHEGQATCKTRRRDNIKMDVIYGGIRLAQHRDQRRPSVNTVMNTRFP
jgi:hypothetical protein